MHKNSEFIAITIFNYPLCSAEPEQYDRLSTAGFNRFALFI